MDNLILPKYDLAVKRAGLDGIKVADARAEVVDEVTRMLVAGELDPLGPTEQAEAIVDRSLVPGRKARRAALHSEVEYLLDALADGTILGRDDPRLAQALPLGDGRDKTLALWAADDWQAALNVRRSKRDELTASVQIFEEAVTTVITAMQTSGSATIADLFSNRSGLEVGANE